MTKAKSVRELEAIICLLLPDALMNAHGMVEAYGDFPDHDEQKQMHTAHLTKLIAIATWLHGRGHPPPNQLDEWAQHERRIPFINGALQKHGAFTPPGEVP